MTFVPKSVTATQTSFRKTRIRSAMLACFSKIPVTTSTPYFRQWHIHAIDITKILSVSRAEARQLMQELRNFFGKSKRDVITVEEFCAFTGIRKNRVRMHLAARQIEHEIKRQYTVEMLNSAVAGKSGNSELKTLNW
ncbi:hypothetical protein A3860_26300 [Niastella vici]|uniref:Uncharacterized protein n=1 Tax=Niastella vici TaxID=1703345 RepID=A0A1V9FX59_9BACT|nr:hypothetical protein [Niastella vici]OQP62826.1 hypothetical protein A3860_26300 [Niastella vici]